MKTQKADVASEGAIDNSRPALPPSNAKPRLALLIATACGLGYLPKAPGTWGSLGGILVTVCPVWMYQTMARAAGTASTETNHSILFLQIALFFAIAAIGVWVADRAAKYWDLKDPQKVVIDEVSGQHLTLLVGCMLPLVFGASGRAPSSAFENLPFAASLLNWKYLLTGFILFRVFDIWKPFPVRQAESLDGGCGIMADDWVAGLYAAIVLWGARIVGL